MTFLNNSTKIAISKIKELLSIDIRWELHRRYFRFKPMITRFPEYGYKLALYPGEHVSDAVRSKRFEEDVCNFIRRFLRPGMIFFDIGANIGLYTVIAGKILKENGEVHSFEPSQREFLRLSKNVRLNRLNNVILNRVAVLDRESGVTLSVCDDTRAAYNSLFTIKHPEAINSVIRNESVRSITIDAYVHHNKVKQVHLIKMDIEGAEIQALRGGSNLLSRKHAPAITFECAECAAQRDEKGEKKLREFCEILSEYGYIIYDFVSADGKIQPVTQKTLHKNWNFVAIKPSALRTEFFT